MRKKLFHLLFAFAMIAIITTSCGSKMGALADSLFTADPSPMELVGTKIPVTVSGRFPAKWFDKNAAVTVIPLIKYDGGEVLGASQTYQGEKVAGNGIIINQSTGGAITLRSEFDYTPEMKKSELFLRFIVLKGGKTINIPDVKVADGVVSTAALADAKTAAPAVAPDKFKRIIEETHDANIMFLIQQAELRSSELNSTNIAAWKQLVKEADENARKNVNIEIAAYASPDGGYDLNEKLAERRERNTANYLTKEFKKLDVDTEINAKYTAQDWEGFKKLVEASNLQDKDIVLRVLSMYPDPETREKEIKNISLIYKDLAETILPQLRRSRLIANVEIIGKTNEEIAKAATSDFGDLSLEELLYSISLPEVSKEKVYTFATQKYPNDYRAWNNLGAYYFANGDIVKAKQFFSRASQVSNSAAEANMNLGLLAISDGDIAKAEQLLGRSAGANTLGEAMGLLYIKKGDYSRAEQSFANSKSNNAALAQILTKNYNKAQQTINAIDKKDATTYYLAAIVAARTNNASGVAGNLKSAIQNGFSKDKIANDTEFARFLTNPDIKNMLSL